MNGSQPGEWPRMCWRLPNRILLFNSSVLYSLILYGFMTCHDLAQRISELQPSLSAVDIARLSLMILIQCDDVSQLSDEQRLLAAWKNATFRLEAATDQHAAVAEELDMVCGDGPIQFSPDQLWVLLRAVKVQSQILELYTDEPALA